MDAELQRIAETTEMDSLPPPDMLPSMAAVTQQHKTRRRRGSLRKAALLGRGAQRERRDSRLLTVTMPHGIKIEEGTASPSPRSGPDRDALGLQVFDFAPVVSQTNAKSTPCPGPPAQSSTNAISSSPQAPQQDSRRISYNSTTDEEDILQMPRGSRPASSKISVYSGSEGYFADRTLVPSRRSFQQAKSPLSYSGMSTSALPPPDSSWDYSETEWWGWVVLTVTWFVFIVGMGSCLNIWSWAWDVGKTPYAPPELEDDPTLPIVGYYPALIILTGVMAWVWVVVAWVGMKYFRHAKISGD